MLLVLSVPLPRCARADDGVDIQVPPDNWTYTVLARFSESGLLPDHPPYEFSGSRIFTRKELAAMVADLADMAATREEFLDPQNRQDLESMVREFQIELQEIGRPVFLPLPVPAVKEKPPEAIPGQTKEMLPPATPQPSRPKADVSSSNSIRIGAKKGEQNSASNLFSAQVKLGPFSGFISSEADKADRQSVDLKLGNLWAMEITRRYLEYTRRRGTAKRLTSFRWGDVSSVNYAEGLTVGSQTLSGISGEAELGPVLRPKFFWGRDQGPEISGADLALAFSSKIETGAGWVKGETDDGVREFFGFHAKYQSEKIRMRAEYSQGRDQGHGFFFGSSLRVNDSMDLRAETHSYRNFSNPFNNPPLYLGVSGGSEEQERGNYFSMEYRLKNRYSLILSRDTAWRFDTGEIYRDTLQQFKTTIGKKAGVTFIREREYYPGASTTIHTFRINKRWPSGIDFSSDLKEELKESGDTRTISLRLRLPLEKLRASLTFDYTSRKTSIDTQRTPQIMINYKLGARHNLSVRGSFPGAGRQYRMDFLLLSKF